MDNHSTNIKKGKTFNCFICGEETYKKPYLYNKLKDKRVTCSRECSREKMSIMGIEKIENRLQVGDFKTWLREKYLVELLSPKEIAEIVYGKPNNSPNIRTYLIRYQIPIRSRSEAVKLQWVDSDSRKKEASELALMTFNNPEVRSKIRRTMKTKEYKKKASLSKMGNKNGMYGVRGKDSPHWNPNKTDEERNRDRKNYDNAKWRNEVFERDRFICRKCSYAKGRILEAHHMDSHHWYIEGRYEVSNGITFCEDCHKEFHSIYGYKNNFKAQTLEFIK